MPGTTALRDRLFGDVPLGQWAGSSADAPWAQFRDAAARIGRHEPSGAQTALETVLAMPGLESRHYLQAWTSLRQLGCAPPPEEALHLYGVVLDVPMPEGVDTLAAYEDRTARYLNYSGAAIVWDAPDDAIGELIASLLTAGKNILARAGPWRGPRPPLPSGQARVSMLTPRGLHFGQAPFDALLRDPVAAPAFEAGTVLMQALVERAPA